MPDTRYLEPTEENVDLAQRVSRGEAAAEGLRILTKSEYFGRPAGMCTHPQGWPCFTSCIVDKTAEEAR